MIRVMNCDRVAYDEFVLSDEFPYINRTLSMSLALNPTFWPICAFGSCNINGYLHFSYSLT